MDMENVSEASYQSQRNIIIYILISYIYLWMVALFVDVSLHWGLNKNGWHSANHIFKYTLLKNKIFKYQRGVNCQQLSIGSGDGLAANRGEAIT